MVSQVGLCCVELTPPHAMQCRTDTHKATHSQKDYAESPFILRFLSRLTTRCYGVTGQRHTASHFEGSGVKRS